MQTSKIQAAKCLRKRRNRLQTFFRLRASALCAILFAYTPRRRRGA